MQKSKRTDDGWTVDDAPYFASEFDAARAMSVMTDEPTFVLPFHGVEDFPPESAPLAVKSAQATLNGLIDPVMFGNPADTDCPTSEVVFVPSMNL